MEKIAITLPSYQLFVDCSHTQIVSSIQLSMAFIAVSFVPGRVCLRIPHVPSPRKDMLSCSRPWLILLLQEEVGMKWNQQTASLMKDLLPADTSTLQIMTLLTSRRVLEVKVHEIPSKPRFNELITFQTSLSTKRTKFKRVEPSGSRIERINFHLSRTARSFTQNNKEIIHTNIYCFPFL